MQAKPATAIDLLCPRVDECKGDRLPRGDASKPSRTINLLCPRAIDLMCPRADEWGHCRFSVTLAKRQRLSICCVPGRRVGDTAGSWCPVDEWGHCRFLVMLAKSATAIDLLCPPADEWGHCRFMLQVLGDASKVGTAIDLLCPQ